MTIALSHCIGRSTLGLISDLMHMILLLHDIISNDYCFYLTLGKARTPFTHDWFTTKQLRRDERTEAANRYKNGAPHGWVEYLPLSDPRNLKQITAHWSSKKTEDRWCLFLFFSIHLSQLRGIHVDFLSHNLILITTLKMFKQIFAFLALVASAQAFAPVTQAGKLMERSSYWMLKGMLNLISSSKQKQISSHALTFFSR